MTREFFWAATTRSLSILASLLSSLLALRLFSDHLKPEVYGVMLLAAQIMGYLPLIDGGFRTVTSRKLLENAADTDRRGLLDFSQVFYSWFGLLLLALSAAAMGVFSLLPAARTLENATALLLAVGFSGAVSVYSASQTNLLIGLQRQSQAYLLTSIGSMGYLLVLWWLFRAGAGVWAIPGATLGSALLVLPGAVALLRRHDAALRFLTFRVGAWFWGLFNTLKREALQCFHSQITMLFLFTLDLILVGILFGPKVVAVYGILSRLIAILRSFLQTLGEVSWPIVARQGLGEQRFNNFLIRINAWIYGSVTGAMCLAIVPFCTWYLGSEWAPSYTLVYLLAARFLVIGLDGPFAYCLYGVGEFRLITRYLQREVVAGLVLAVLLSRIWGVDGVAAGFLAATLFGTAFPIIGSYCRKVSRNAAGMLLQVWWRALAALAVSFGASWFLSSYGSGILPVLISAAAGLASGLLVAAIVCILRAGSTAEAPAQKPIYRLLQGI